MADPGGPVSGYRHDRRPTRRRQPSPRLEKLRHCRMRSNAARPALPLRAFPTRRASTGNRIGFGTGACRYR
ncbi:hypothetical protein OH687_13020 [Burkholderia anthina]|nr:hypothetical protein OH687_13020 [Burkholderia anthina]